MAEKLTKMSVVRALEKQSGSRNDKLFSAHVNHAIFIIEQLTDDEINKVKSLKVFLDNIDNPSSLINPAAEISAVIDELEKVHSNRTEHKGKAATAEVDYKKEAAIDEVNKYVGGSAKRRGFAALLWTLLGIGVIITVVFAFLDNFHVIDYGGMAAGAAGIIDLAIGALACIVERVSDAKHTKSMAAAQKVDDEKSYKEYKAQNSIKQVGSFFNTNTQIIQDGSHSDDETEDIRNSIEQAGSWFNRNSQTKRGRSRSDKEE